MTTPYATVVSEQRTSSPATPLWLAGLHVLVSLALAIGGWLLIDWLRAPVGSEPYLDALWQTAWHVATLAVMVSLLTLLARPVLPTHRAVTLLLSTATLLMIALFFAERWAGDDQGNLLRWLLMLVASGTLSIAVLLNARRTPRLPLILGTLLGFWVLFAGLPQQGIAPRLWWSPEDTAYLDPNDGGGPDQGLWRELEPILFAQPARIDVALSQLDTEGSEPKTYFVGFAGYGEERVFAEEVRFAADIVAERFATRNRSLFLINDRRDLASAPLASPSALSYGLRELGKIINPDQDLVVLMLSSHGSDQPALAVSNGYVPVRDLTPKALRLALDRAGIRWRVIIVSACYAGGFIPELATPESVVVAAAAPDRTSFGCSDQRELTYFGEAFLRDSLLYLPTLDQAFEQANVLVTAREKEEGFQPSRPQAHFGTAISAQLDSWLRPPCEPTAPGRPRSSGCPNRSPAR
ncbi:MAG: C13 family peptidase [Pseudomonadota bacterium]